MDDRAAPAFPSDKAPTLAALMVLAEERLAARAALVKDAPPIVTACLTLHAPRNSTCSKTNDSKKRDPRFRGDDESCLWKEQVINDKHDVVVSTPLPSSSSSSPRKRGSRLVSGSMNTALNVDNLLQELAAIHTALPKGGLFLGAALGGQSFYEMRECLMEAEVELSGGASLRVPALPEAADLARAMSAAGFAHVVVDVERVTLAFDDLFALMQELRAAGCANRHKERPRAFTRSALFARAAALYANRFPAEDGGITATADLIFLHGWKEPHA